MALDTIWKNNGNVNTGESGKVLVPHNRIDRLGGGTISGGVFFQEEESVDVVKGRLYDCYAASPEYDARHIHLMFAQALQSGYGRDKSIGRGVIDVINVESWSPPTVENSNAVMLLGPCARAIARI